MTKNNPLSTFSCTLLNDHSPLVSRWDGEEALSCPYRFTVVLAMVKPVNDENTLVGQQACLSLYDNHGHPCPYHGVITSAELLDDDNRYHYCSVILEPRITLLQLHHFSDIWLDKNLTDILRNILNIVGLQEKGNENSDDTYDFEFRFMPDIITRTKKSFIFQFEESCFSFISRIMEHYGCYYFFEQKQDREVLVVCNHKSFQSKISLPVLYRSVYNPLKTEQQAVIHSFISKSQNRPAKVILQDFAASHARLKLSSESSVAALYSSETSEDARIFTGYQSFYGEHFDNNAQGDWLAELRAQAVACRHREYRGSGRITGLRAGYMISLKDHPRNEKNDDYQVIKVEHHGMQPLPGIQDDELSFAADNCFVAIPHNSQFRPALTTGKPCIRGGLSAIVDGDESGKPFLNENGCYKVIFPFLKNLKKNTRCSAWIRMLTLSTGPDHGMHFPLHKGAEVLVTFLAGDPDRPVITGSVFNSENPNKVNRSNVTQSGVSTVAGHYIAMEDNYSHPHIKVATPAENTAFTLGSGDISGAHLRTDACMRLSSSTYEHEVPGAYSLKIQGNYLKEFKNNKETQPYSEQDLNKAEIKGETSTEVNWGKADVDYSFESSAKVDVSAKTAVAEIVAAALQTKFAAAGLKLEIIAAAADIQIKTAGYSAEIKKNKGHYSMKNDVKSVSKAQVENTEDYELTIQNRLKIQAILTENNSQIIKYTAKDAIEFSVGDNKIVINNEGIKISAKNIILDNGLLVVRQGAIMNCLAVSGDVCCGSLTSPGLISGNEASFTEIKAEDSLLGSPVQPPDTTLLFETKEQSTQAQGKMAATETQTKSLTDSSADMSDDNLTPARNMDKVISNLAEDNEYKY